MTLPELKVGVVTMAFGGGPFYASNVLCFESYHPVNARLSALLYLGTVLGVKVWPFMVSQFVEEHPFVLFRIGLLPGLSASIYLILRLFRKRILTSMS